LSFTLDDVVPWGRTLDEYVAMFALSDADRAVSILGCGDGPASFNAEGTAQGMRIVSADPLYDFRVDDIRARIDAVAPTIAEQLRHNASNFVWSQYATADALIDARMAAMQRFLADYPAGLNEGRYVTGSATQLPFLDNTFDLALCSHFLFLYSEQLDEVFHVDAVRELCRVAEEVRIFPLLDLGAVESPHVAAVVAALQADGLTADRVRVPYEFQKGGNQMLRLRAAGS
jgi:hypothetical protein